MPRTVLWSPPCRRGSAVLIRHSHKEPAMTTSRRTSRRAARAPLAALTLLCASTLSPLRAQVVERFAKDPLDGGGRHVFFAEGDVAARFTYLSDEPERF